jgi:hypothetical protein
LHPDHSRQVVADPGDSPGASESELESKPPRTSTSDSGKGLTAAATRRSVLQAAQLASQIARDLSPSDIAVDPADAERLYVLAHRIAEDARVLESTLLVGGSAVGWSEGADHRGDQ